jgi:hypothetical protein
MFIYFLMIGIFVAVLLLIRTTVKRAANEAFELEMIEKEGFTFLKSEGFLNPINDKFEAYSSEYSEGGIFRKCWLEITEDDSLRKPFQNTAVRTEKGVEIETFFKIIANKNLGKTFKLEISVVKQHKAEFIGRINQMLENFKVR